MYRNFGDCICAIQRNISNIVCKCSCTYLWFNPCTLKGINQMLAVSRPVERVSLVSASLRVSLLFDNNQRMKTL